MKEGSESTLGCEASAQRRVSRSGRGGGAQADLERLLHTEGWASAGATGRCPRCSGQARTPGEQELIKNEGGVGRDRAGGAWGHVNKRWRWVTDLV